MTLTKPQAFIFDWDNTLVNTWPIIHAALTATFHDMGKEAWSFADTKLRVRKSMRDSFPELFGDRWEEAGERYQLHYRKNHLSNLEALPQAEDLLRVVKEAGLFSVIVSNKKGPNLRQEAAHLGFSKWFDALVGADDASHDKPFAAPVNLAFKNAAIPLGAHVWFVGDSDIDLECAKNTGCTGILYGPTPQEQGDYTATHFKDQPYAAHVQTHDELIALLHRFC